MLYCKCCNFWVSGVLTDFLLVLGNNEDKTREIFCKSFWKVERLLLIIAFFNQLTRNNWILISHNQIGTMCLQYILCPWRCETNVAKTRPCLWQIISQFSLLIFYNLCLFFKMSHNNLSKTYFGSGKYWILVKKTRSTNRP